MEPRTLTYRRSWLVRIFGVIMMLLMTSGPVFIWLAVAQEHAVNSGFYGFLTFYALLCAALDVMFLRWTGPKDMYFDLDHKTYRYITGWPFFAKTRTGPLSDLGGVYVRETRNQGYFLVGVVWQSGDSVTLEMFSNRSKAEQLAASLMSDLELKQVMPPRHLRPYQ